MKTIKYILLVIGSSLFLIGCQKWETLKRDNPLDGKNEVNENTNGEVALNFNSYSIYSDNNGDKIVNPGETIRMRISLKNTGSSTAKNVKATFSTTSSYISVFSSTSQITYGDISANGVKWASNYGINSEYESGVNYTIEFTVSNSAPAGTQIQINLSMVDESGNTWTDSFTVPVLATNAKIVYNSYSIYSDNNGDKIVNNGETIRMRISLKNTGSSTAKNVKATFSTTSSYISVFSSTSQITYGDISANGVKWASNYGINSEYESGVSYTIEFTVSNSAPAGTQIPISISMVDESGNTWTDSFTVPVLATNAKVVYNSYSIYSDNNGDKIVNTGETIRMRISLKNTGSSTAKNVKATFSTTSSYISVFSSTSPITYGDISANGVKWASNYGINSEYESGVSYTIEFTVSNSAPAGTQIPISISMVDESGNTWTDSFTVPVQ